MPNPCDCPSYAQTVPQSTLLVARVALAIDEGLRPVFSRAVYDAEFAKGRAIADRAVVAEGAEALALAREVSIQPRYRWIFLA